MAVKKTVGRKAVRKLAASKQRAVRKQAAGSRSITVKSRKKSAATAPNKRLLPPPGEVIVRMYRQGLGDCFLLAFATENPADPRYVLIDCGVHMRQTEGRKRLLQVMENLTAATGNHLHVVVPTHEHADHLVGFVQKGSPFLKPDPVSIDNLWLAWTEKIGDPQADRLRAKRGSARTVIEQAIKKTKERANRRIAGIKQLTDRVERILEFEKPDAKMFDAADRSAVEARIASLGGPGGANKAVLAAYLRRFGTAPATALTTVGQRERASSNELALGLLGMLANHAEYCEPGQRLAIPDVDGVRAYVLGPPRAERLLKQDKPAKVRGSSEHEFIETYLSGGSASFAFALSPALGSGAEVNDDLRYPFAAELRRPIDGSKSSLPPLYRHSYLGADSAWRRVDGDWLGSAETLALNLYGVSNNMSLVLAFELGAAGVGPVLLFAADAQVGNWLSWRDQTYGKGGGTSCTADDLLNRTLLYKAGHHGSHNATLKFDPRARPGEGGGAYGLELMSDIIAMIPIDRAAADKNMPTPWRMPHRPLYERLREKADRRILRADGEIAPLSANELEDIKPGSTAWEAVPGKPGLFWRSADETFSAGTPGPLYYDLRIPIPNR